MKQQQWYHSKRSHQNTFHQNQHHHDRRHHEQEETMDDLLVAAEYAVIRPWNTTASAAVTAVTTNTTGNGNTGTADTSRRRALNTGNITSTDTATKCQATEDEPTGMEIDRDSAEIDLSDSCLVTGDESIDPDRSTNGTEPPATDRNGEEGTKNSPTCGTMPLNSSETDTIDENNVGQHINVREDSTNAGYLDRNSSDDHDDDDESEVDLETELQRMTHADAEEESPLDAPTKLKTVHEIDPYQDNFEQLRKSELPVDVNLPEQERLLNAAKPPLDCAGQIKHHLASERTVVIQCQAGGPVLEEGTMLVLRFRREQEERIVPMGRILEVFGPVSQPLYTVRIPELLPVSDARQTATEIHDPWIVDGEYTRFLQDNPDSWTVFYCKKEAKILDPKAIFKISGRGCDASNMYDEEITNPHELDYSDDEEERLARRRGKGTNDARGGATNPPDPSIARRTKPHRPFISMGREQQQQHPCGFHQVEQHAYHMPTFFNHGPTSATWLYPPVQMMQYPLTVHSPFDYGIVPPPPPPPPPPPRKEEESDTVYFDPPPPRPRKEEESDTVYFD